MAPVLGVSLYTWTSVIGVVLAGISLGNYLGGRLADRWASLRLLGGILAMGGLSCLCILAVDELCRLTPDDEVIIAAYTFCATAIPFGETGAKIVWADMDPKTWAVDPGDIDPDPVVAHPGEGKQPGMNVIGMPDIHEPGSMDSGLGWIEGLWRAGVENDGAAGFPVKIRVVDVSEKPCGGRSLLQLGQHDRRVRTAGLVKVTME